MFSNGYKFFREIVYCLQKLLPDFKKNVKQKIPRLKAYQDSYDRHKPARVRFIQLSLQ